MWLDDDGGAWSVGPQTDGTYGIPVTAQQVNSPAGVAGYASSWDQQAIDILKFGVGAVTDAWKFNQALDYKKFEATNGGLYAQGAPAGVQRTAAGSISPTFLLAAVALVGFLILTTHKA